MGLAEGDGESQGQVGNGGRGHGLVPLLHQQPEVTGLEDSGGGTPTPEHREFIALDLGRALS